MIYHRKIYIIVHSLPYMHLLQSIIFSLITATSLYAAEPKKTIILDPGHEPWNKQSSWYQSGEAQANLKFAKSLEATIMKEGKYEVITTLNEQGYNPLLVNFEKKQREKVTSIRQQYNDNKKLTLDTQHYYQMLHVRALFFQPEYKTQKADIFVSIHHNVPGEEGSKMHYGFCIYYSDNGACGEQSKDLAVAIKNALVKAGYQLSTNGGEKKGFFAKDFAVLHHATKAVPAVLMELGYITHHQDKEDAYDNEKVAQKAKVIYRVLDDFLSRRK